jgi:hypothetical protein
MLFHRQRLAGIAARHTDNALELVEYYESQFKQHVTIVEKLLHDVYIDIAALGKQATHPVSNVQQHEPEKFEYLAQQYLMEEKSLLTLRQSFNQFCATWI